VIRAYAVHGAPLHRLLPLTTVRRRAVNFMSEVVTMMALALGTQVIGLAGLALRLRWWGKRDRGRQQALVALASRLPAMGVVHVDDARADGSRLQVHITTDSEFSRTDCRD